MSNLLAQFPFTLLACGLGALLAAAPAHAVDLHIAAQQGSDPKFVSADKGAAVEGLCIDIFRAIEQVDPGLRFVGDQHWMPLNRILAELAAGKQDAACALQHTSERDSQYVYVEPALYPVNYVLMAREDDALTVNNWDDVRRLRPEPIILANRGFASVTVLGEVGGLHVDASATDTEINLQKLAAGRGRLYFHRGPGLQRMIRRAGVEGKVKILPLAMVSTKFHLVMSKRTAPALVERVQRALAQLDKNGELERLRKKWE